MYNYTWDIHKHVRKFGAEALNYCAEATRNILLFLSAFSLMMQQNSKIVLADTLGKVEHFHGRYQRFLCVFITATCMLHKPSSLVLLLSAAIPKRDLSYFGNLDKTLLQSKNK